jgi:hypothetical protein
MARAPRRGLLLTRVDAAVIPAKERLASAMQSFIALPAARADVSNRSISMIKDIIVNLEHEIARDPARDFAITVVENRSPRARRRSIRDRTFRCAARRSLVSAEHRLLKPLGVIAPEILSRRARHFDLSVLMQSEPGGVNKR